MVECTFLPSLPNFLLCHSCSPSFPAESQPPALPRCPSSGVLHALWGLLGCGARCSLLYGLIQSTLLSIPVSGTLLPVPVSSWLSTVEPRFPLRWRKEHRDRGCCPLFKRGYWHAVMSGDWLSSYLAFGVKLYVDIYPCKGKQDSCVSSNKNIYFLANKCTPSWSRLRNEKISGRKVKIENRMITTFSLGAATHPAVVR